MTQHHTLTLVPDVLAETARGHVCAAYARYSDSDLQSVSSNEQQIRACREAAAKDGGQIPGENVFADAGVLGSEEDRPELNRLMDVIRSKRANFKHLYVFETARLARDSELASRLRKFFAFHGIILHFVSNGMVSGSSGFDLQHGMHSLFDQQFSKTLAANVRRGHKDQLLKGYVPYGRCYGYRNVSILDPTLNDSFDDKRRRVGVKHEIDPVESEVVRLIFDLYLRHGYGYQAICKRLNELGYKSPRKPTKNTVRGWQTSAIRTILSNARYIGIITHSKVETLRDPETKKFVHRQRPESEWVSFTNTDLRIISDEDFEAVRARMTQQKDRKDQQKQGGLNRTHQSRTYLWSGLLKCGECGGALSICQPNTYMCTTNFRKLGCRNRLKLNRDSLERHLMETLAAALKRSETFQRMEQAFTAEIRKQQEQQRRAAAYNAARRDSAQAEILRLTKEAEGLVLAMAQHGFSDTFSRVLREKEVQKQALIELVSLEEQRYVEINDHEVREYLSKALENLADVLMSDPIRCRDEIRKRVTGLMLDPIMLGNAPAYRIRGDVRLFGGEEPKMLSGNGSISAKHLEFTVGLNGLTLKMDKKGQILRVLAADEVAGGELLLRVAA
jgi:DNA invertase Pin-like site-specific DNA recombinase